MAGKARTIAGEYLLKSETPTRLAFVRHGEVHNPKQVFYGRLNGFDLSEEGCRQAAATGRFLTERFSLDQIYSSPMLRAHRTAAIIGQGKPVAESLHLNEVHSFLEGQPIAVMAGRQWDAYTGAPAKYEQPEAIVARLSQFIQEVLERHPGQTVVAVSHGDPIAFLFLSLRGKALLPANRFEFVEIGLGDSYPAHASIMLLEFQTAVPAEIPAISYYKPYE
jgi:broad specificity phosphatase PhoE